MSGVFQGKAWINDWTPDHFIGCREIVIVMTVGAAEGDHGGDGVAAPTSAARTAADSSRVPAAYSASATPESSPISMPTSMVVVLDKTSIAGSRGSVSRQAILMS